MFSCCQFAIFNTLTVWALVCHIETYPRITDDNRYRT